MSNGNRVVLILLIVGAILLFSPFQFSSINFESKYGPVIRVNREDPNFNIDNVVGGSVTFETSSCYPEGEEAPITNIILDGNSVATGIPPVTCEQDIFNGGDGDLGTNITHSVDFELDSSFLSDINVMGADSINFVVKVQCTQNTHCIDSIRRTTFNCDLEDYTCKLPEDIIVETGTSKFDDEEIFNLPTLTILTLILAAVFFLTTRRTK